MVMANAFWPNAVVGEAHSVNYVLASACHKCGPKSVTPRYWIFRFETLSFFLELRFLDTFCFFFKMSKLEACPKGCSISQLAVQ